MAVIYGRRRIGKSLLIQKSLENQRALTFEGLENRPKKDQIETVSTQQSVEEPIGTP